MSETKGFTAAADSVFMTNDGEVIRRCELCGAAPGARVLHSPIDGSTEVRVYCHDAVASEVINDRVFLSYGVIARVNLVKNMALSCYAKLCKKPDAPQVERRVKAWVGIQLGAAVKLYGDALIGMRYKGDGIVYTVTHIEYGGRTGGRVHTTPGAFDYFDANVPLEVEVIIPVPVKAQQEDVKAQEEAPTRKVRIIKE